MTWVSVKLILLSVLTFLVGAVRINAADGNSLKRYDESIFVVSNFSGVDAVNTEKSSLQDLIDRNIDGFRFNIEWEKTSNKLVLKEANGNTVPLSNILNIIKSTLDKDKLRILTIFLDFNVNSTELIKAFETAGLIPYIYQHDEQLGWPSLKKMTQDQKRLVVFTMQEHRPCPHWLHYIWDYAVEPYFSLIEAPEFVGEFLKGNPNNDLLIYNELNSQEIGLNEKMNNVVDLNPYLIEHIRSIWSKTGKTPNFIILDKFEPGIFRVVNYLNGTKTIHGTVTYNTQPLNYVSWEGRNSLTSGRYSFPIGPGDNVTLTPRSPGYRFKPESVPLGEVTQDIEQHFIAFPLDINDGLEAYYKFDGGTDDAGGKGLNGKAVDVGFRNDSLRKEVAYFNNRSHIVLPKAEEFKVRDHDFTVSVWVKVEEFLPNKIDYCILGTPTNSYQEGIHLVIRNKKPYFGFFSNDLEGKTIVEEGKWYHLVWRYTKLNGEQAIYVNGRLDSRSLGHPSYKGREKLIIGLAGFSIESNMYGYLDNLAVWSRALGNEEIWGLSKNVIDPLPYRSFIFRYGYWIASIVILLIIAGYFLLRKKQPAPKAAVEGIIPKRIEIGTDNKQKNFIQLFGDFKIVNKDGEDISLQFTPKLKQLFLVILLYSQRNKKGISTKELTDILWPNHSYQNAKNSRGVTIRKLRLLLEALDKVEIVFHVDTWSMVFSGNIYCDYLECLRLLENGDSNDKAFFPAFYSIVGKGEIFKGESHDWLDDFKGYIVNNEVDILIKYIQHLDREVDLDFIIKLSDRILLADPVNEEALSFKLKALIKQNNYKTARFSYEKFSSNYLEMYGEKFSIPFDKIIGQTSHNVGSVKPTP
jgi:two-component SAPR family response regulator